jgi:hypothetical protein
MRRPRSILCLELFALDSFSNSLFERVEGSARTFCSELSIKPIQKTLSRTFTLELVGSRGGSTAIGKKSPGKTLSSLVAENQSSHQPNLMSTDLDALGHRDSVYPG